MNRKASAILAATLAITKQTFKLEKFSDGLRSGQYPFNDEELDKLSKLKDKRHKKAYLCMLKEKYKGQVKT